MAEIQLLGLFHEATPTADTIDQLHALGVTDDKITIMSGMPYRAEIFGQPRVRGRVGHLALLGAILGVLTALFLTVGIFLLYPIHVGGQPLVPVPPSLIILFEVTMLGTMWAAFFSLLVENRFPVFRKQIYDPRITEGHIGVVAQVDEAQADQVIEILTANGAHHLKRAPVEKKTDVRLTVFWVGALASVVVVLGVLELFAYDVIKLPFPTQMTEQDSVGYEQGPRLAAPAAAVPIQGPALISNQPATQPIPATADSIARGKVFFGINCAMCHGQDGTGNGPLSGYFSPKPANLTGATEKSLSDQTIFLIITQGRSPMPSLAENLDPAQRWDVINYVRSLQQK